MAKNQLQFLHGLITIEVSGEYIEPFIRTCVQKGSQISNVKYLNENEVQMTIRLEDWTTFRRLRKRFRCRIKVKSTSGLPFFLQRMKRHTALWAAVLCSFLVVILMANTLWSIKIDGVTPEVEAEVQTQLKSYGIKPGKFTFSMKKPREVQRLLLEDVSDLLWIGVKKQGTSYQLYGVMETNYDETEQPKPSNIVASKKGMITSMFISKGRPLAEVNDVVKKGTLLATGELKEESGEFIQSEGKVMAETWYRAEVEIPEKQNIYLTDGDSVNSYSLKIGKVTIPVWGFWRKESGEERQESFDRNFHILSWRLPFQLQETTIYTNEHMTQNLSKNQAVTKAQKSAEKSLLNQLGEEAEITEGKILHQRKDRGKVKLILLFKVNENIAETKYVSQGD
ncbi:sporulation protein YqfD [Halobacillus sp. Marseille-Q1614]|uniref:sporulation protein YqfD n=1 Tax=Halobacillus sp. Marseille-Q1614 TaxID=2709134 RepID=UPI00156D729E|nr:sporulation protein YqfD [Halobacillus sp. Marseille-Q1614]